MKTEQPTQIKSDPTTGPGLKIIPTANGWVLYVGQGRLIDLCYSSPNYVFNSPAELGKAVANLVQFGCIENPPAVVPEGMRPVSEFTTPTIDDVVSLTVTLWFRFTTANGLVDRFCDHENQSCSRSNPSENTNIFQWMVQAGATYFRPLRTNELPT